MSIFILIYCHSRLDWQHYIVHSRWWFITYTQKRHVHHLISTKLHCAPPNRTTEPLHSQCSKFLLHPKMSISVINLGDCSHCSPLFYWNEQNRRQCCWVNWMSCLRCMIYGPIWKRLALTNFVHWNKAPKLMVHIIKCNVYNISHWSNLA